MAIKFEYLPVTSMRITSDFGPRNTGIPGASTYHKGIDIGGSQKGEETPIFAVAAGKVVNNYWNDYRGWTVILDHGDFKTLYQHLKAPGILPKGSHVWGGQRIGIMGNSSNPKVLKIAVHLHFELIVAGKQVDPLPYFNRLLGVEDLTREETIALIKEILAEGTEKSAAASASADQPSAWAEPFWNQAKKEEIIDGTKPKGYCTREQVAAMILRAQK